jgi:hypothetical protein
MSRISTTVKDALRWLYALSKYLLQELPLVVIVVTSIVLLIALAIAFWVRSEPAFRWSGLALQLLGTATVAWNIHGTRTLFHLAGVFALAAQSWQRRPRFRPPPVNFSVATMMPEFNFSARLDTWHYADPNAASALEARLDAAEKNLTSTRDRLNKLEERTTQSLQQHANALEQEKLDRANDAKNVRDELKVAQAGGLHISVVGVLWLVAGVIMSTIPSELACLAGYLFP